MPKQSATAAATLDAAPAAAVNATPAAPTRDYIVAKGCVEKAGEMYRPGDTIALTDAEAEHPLATGVVRIKDAE